MTDQEALATQERVLAEAGERWLEAKAAGASTERVEADVRAAEDNFRRLSNKINRKEKRNT